MTDSSKAGAAAAVDPAVIKRVKARKARRALRVRYRDRPKVAFVVHSFNRISNLKQLVGGLRRLGAHELIVCEDGSLDGSREKWLACLTRPNDFLICSNDLHEIRISDRAIRFARAEIVCLVQDDDLIPRESGWLKAALAHFEAHPKLAILGGFMGFNGFHPHPKDERPIWGPAPFQFVHHVNIGPYFVRKAYYEALGGWDYAFSGVGEPGICFESELCLRAWLAGYQVGYRFVPFKGPAGRYAQPGGTLLFSGAVRRRNQLRNHKRIYGLYAGEAGRIERLVRQANRRAGIVPQTAPGGRSVAEEQPC
jgi:glycosyltransferase involved in cell wall biosynthesis